MRITALPTWFGLVTGLVVRVWVRVRARQGSGDGLVMLSMVGLGVEPTWPAFAMSVMYTNAESRCRNVSPPWLEDKFCSGDTASATTLAIRAEVGVSQG